MAKKGYCQCGGCQKEDVEVGGGCVKEGDQQNEATGIGKDTAGDKEKGMRGLGR